MPLVAAEANQMLTTETTRLAYLSIHTADPSTTGANEAVGGSYARAALTGQWGTASGGSISAAQQTFTPNAGTYGFGGYWTAASGGTFLGSFTFSASKTLATGDTLKVTPTLTETLS